MAIFFTVLIFHLTGLSKFSKFSTSFFRWTTMTIKFTWFFQNIFHRRVKLVLLYLFIPLNFRSDSFISGMISIFYSIKNRFEIKFTQKNILYHWLYPDIFNSMRYFFSNHNIRYYIIHKSIGFKKNGRCSLKFAYNWSKQLLDHTEDVGI